MADIKLSALAAASTLTASDLIYVVQGAASRRATVQQVLNLVPAAGGLTAQAANTVLANATASSAVPTAVAIGASKLFGRGSTGNLTEVTLGSNLTFTGTTLNASGTLSGTLANGDYGDITVSGTGTVMTIDAGVVTLAKMASMTTASLLGRNTAATGVPEVLSAATVKTILSLNNVDNTSDANKPVSTAQATALALKRDLAPNEQAVASSATVTPTFSNDQVVITAQAVALTLANPTGTAVNGWGTMLRIRDSGVAQAISWGAIYRGIGLTLPSTTVAGKMLYVGMIYNSNATKWDVISVVRET